MGFEDLVTKEDLRNLKQELLQNLKKEQEAEKVPLVVVTENACLMFDHISGVSDKFLHGLRRQKKLNGKKIGGRWFWNVQEIKRLLPQDPE